MKLSQFYGVIYDMDGVLTDSEPLWKIALEEVFNQLGCNLTKQDFQRTVGLRIDEVIAYWYNEVKWIGPTNQEVEQSIINKMIHLLNTHAKPLPGVLESLEYFKSKGLKIGLATSSYSVLIDCVLDTLNIRHYFDYTYSAENERYGKPHPGVYLHVAEKLDLNPRHCLVVEDSFTGVIAGKAARMFVVCVPEKTHHPDQRLIAADKIFDNLNEVIDHFV